MNKGIVKIGGKFQKRRELGGEDSEFCIGCVEFEIPIVYPGVGVQKAVGKNVKSEVEVKVWQLLTQGSLFQNTYGL